MPVLKQQEVFAGRYLLHQLIGEGGFSEVWMAKDQMADEAVVALKVYAPQQGLDEWGLRQFRNEFALTHHLSHLHLLKVHHFDIADGIPYLVMTYCRNGSLGRELQRKGIFNERQVALVMCQIGSALAEIHSQELSIIHQDIKPDNILLLQPDTYVLADFGISSRIRHTLTRTSISPLALSVAYAPPERFDHRPTANAASDIFSLGVTLYEMCTNTVPWEGAGGQCLLKGARIPTLPLGYSPELSKILQACMSVDPDNRPTAADLYQKGKQYLETGQWPRSKRKKKKRYHSAAFIASMATATVAFAAVAGISLYDLEQEPPVEQATELSTAIVGAGLPGAGHPEIKEKAPKSTTAEKESSSKKEHQAKKKPTRAKTIPRMASKEAPTQQLQSGKTAQPPKGKAAEEWSVKSPVEAAFEEQPAAIVSSPKQTVERQLSNVQQNEVLPITTQPAPNPTPSAVETASNQPKKTAVIPASGKDDSSPSEVKRPSTSNTSISNEKKTVFDFNKKPDSDKKWRQYKRNYQKRMKKLRRGN